MYDIAGIVGFMEHRIGLLQAMMYHVDNTVAGSGESAELSPEIMAFYAKGTVLLAKHYIAKFKDIPLPTTNKENTESILY